MNTSLPTLLTVSDFETTVYENQTNTLVWAAAIVKFYSEDVGLFTSIESYINYLFLLSDMEECHIITYFHNLKFDGSFILNYFLSHPKDFYHGVKSDNTFTDFRDMRNHEFSYVIAMRGQWYKILIKHNNKKIEIRDSAKLLPFSVEELGKSFGTKHRKLSMDYNGFRTPGQPIPEHEARYIKNDVLVVKEALEILFDSGHNKLTIGACCMAEFKSLFDKKDYATLFPNLYDIPLDKDKYKYENVGKYIVKSYRGAWCYLVKGKEKRLFKNGTTYDINSLYPYVMHSASGFSYPIGKPHFWQGNYIPEYAKEHFRYYFIRFRTRFKIKPGMLPTIQIKGNSFYNPKQWLETSDIFYKGKYYREIEGKNGEIIQARPEFVFTMWDYKLMLEHYDLEDFEILDGCWFYSTKGIFDQYIDHYKEIKIHSKGAKRTEAKLFSNNLYGKMASSPDSSYRIAKLDENLVLKYDLIPEAKKEPGYIPIGSAITSHARYFTITHAQENFHGVDKPGFIYADTDSLHGDLAPENWINIEEHPTEYGKWKCEGQWDEATFIMAKTYIEHITMENHEKTRPHYNVTAAGMPKECKKYLQRSLDGIKVAKKEKKKLNPKICKFINTKRTLEDFKPGLIIPGALKATNFPGGVLLVERDHTVR